MNYKNRRWVSTFLVIIFIVQMFGGYVLAAPENDILKETKSQLFFETRAISNEEEALAKKMAENYLQIAFDLQDGFGTSISSPEGIYLGNGFSAYELTEYGVAPTETVYFPVVQNNTVLFFIIVDRNPETGELYSGSQSGFADLINQYCENDSYKVIYYKDKEYLVSTSDIIPLENTYDEKDLIELKEILAKTPSTNSNDTCRTDVFTSIRSLNLKNEPRTMAYRGFNINQTYYKVLEMAYCNVDQKDKSGTPRGLCWAATAATIIRYRTGNRTITGWQLADELGIDYNRGGYPDEAYEAMKRHGAVENQYVVVPREVNSSTEIKHNINNQFPIYVDTKYNAFVGHAVTLIGYQEQNSIMTIIYWNSASLKIETTQYAETGRTAFHFGTKKYTWQNSILVPLK